MGGIDESLETTLAYHERTKHHPGRYARSLGHMDWATQPDPFRRFAGAPLLPLDLVPPGDQPRYERAFFRGSIPPEPLDRRWVSQLFHDSLALSAWKQAGGARWSLRVNPSSGNLHPTEGYLIAGPVEGLHDRPAVYHYAPHEHALERRADLADEAWAALAGQLPPGSVLVGLTSIHWREAWKYGERAFRYCHHDLGHAIGAVAVAAAGLGWEARLLEGVTDAELARLLGRRRSERDPRPRMPIACSRSAHRTWSFRSSSSGRSRLGARAARWPTDVAGRPQPPQPRTWAALARDRRGGRRDPQDLTDARRRLLGGARPRSTIPSPRAIRRWPCARSCNSGGARSLSTAARGLHRDAFFQILLKTIAGKGQIPFTTLAVAAPHRPVAVRPSRGGRSCPASTSCCATRGARRRCAG